MPHRPKDTSLAGCGCLVCCLVLGGSFAYLVFHIAMGRQFDGLDFGVPLLALVLSGLGAWYWYPRGSAGDRAESALARQLEQGVAQAGPPLPDLELSDSPGTVLAVCLKPEMTPVADLLAKGIVFAVVLGIGLLFAGIGVRGWKQGDWGGLLCPGVMGGIFLITSLVLGAVFLKALRVFLAVGPTRVELAAHPLIVGQQVELHVAQEGSGLRVAEFEVVLLCEEQATYRQGTDTITDKKLVVRLPLLKQTHFQVDRDRPFEARGTLALPADAMHSFKAANNALVWKVRVRAELENGLDFERDHVVLVLPPHYEEMRP
jgi:hypothetical protein